MPPFFSLWLEDLQSTNCRQEHPWPSQLMHKKCTVPPVSSRDSENVQNLNWIMTRFGRRLGWRDRHRKTLQQARDDCTLFPIRWLELESNSNRLCAQPSQSITAFIRRHQRLSHTGLWHFTDNHRHRGQGNGIDRAFAENVLPTLGWNLWTSSRYRWCRR